MQSNIYVGLSAQIALLKTLDTISSNMANVNTAGFRADRVRSGSTSVDAAGDHVTFAAVADTFLDRASGATEKTGNALDIAIQGDGYLAMKTSTGRVFSRDGRLSMSSTGSLESINGNPILDASDAPIFLDPNGGPPSISKDGMITQKGRQIGAIGLFRLDPNASISRRAGSSLVSDASASPILDFTGNGVQQGFIERSNVNPVELMTRLIATQRQFDAITSSGASSETSLNDAIKMLGSSA